MIRKIVTFVGLVSWLLAGNQAAAVPPTPFPSSPNGLPRDSYLTHFRWEERVVYEPHVEYVQRPVSRAGWNPFRTSGIEVRSIPTVRWVPRLQTQKVPKTERVTQIAPKEMTNWR